MALEVANSELDSVLEQKRNIKLGLISQLEQCELELKDMNGILSEIQDAYGKKQEDIKRLQEQLQAKQYVQAKFKSFWQWCGTYLKLLACQLLCWSEHMLKELIRGACVPCSGPARQFMVGSQRTSVYTGNFIEFVLHNHNFMEVLVGEMYLTEKMSLI